MYIEDKSRYLSLYTLNFSRLHEQALVKNSPFQTKKFSIKRDLQLCCNWNFKFLNIIIAITN